MVNEASSADARHPDRGYRGLHRRPAQRPRSQQLGPKDVCGGSGHCGLAETEEVPAARISTGVRVSARVSVSETEDMSRGN